MKRLKNKKKILIISLLLIILIIAVITGSKVIINKIQNNNYKKELKEFDSDIYSVNGDTAVSLLTFKSEDGIESITVKNSQESKDYTLKCNGKTSVAMDYKMQDFNHYEFEVKYVNGLNKVFQLDFEIPRIAGEYTLKNGVYVNEPDISTGFVKEKTRYLYLNDSGVLVSGNWITNDEPANWYDYENGKWANILLENNGFITYLVWIPRYVYKVDSSASQTENERMDVRFVNTRNEYVDGTTGEITTYDELLKQGYKLPEAFTWEMGENGYKKPTILPGYWITKYQIEDVSSNELGFLFSASDTEIKMEEITTTNTNVVSYKYYINGQEVASSSDGANKKVSNTYNPGEIIYGNVTGFDSEGRIVNSVTKELKPAKVNEPDLSAFIPETTFYVYWDEEGNEHSDIPITEEPPSSWYNYAYSNWANVVVKNNDLESYFVWIPRYEYITNSAAQVTEVNFLQGTDLASSTEYKVPEAFSWQNNSGDTVQLTGYWISKYQVNHNTTTNALKIDGTGGSAKGVQTWIPLVRKMEASGGTMGMTETFNADCTSSSTSNRMDVHMQKNTEYGAMALLSASSYGSPKRVGKNETTTGNLYGVTMYGNSEWASSIGDYVPEGMKNINGRYINKYSYSTATPKAGDATTETAGWHGATVNYWIFGTNFGRGRDYYGAFLRNVSMDSSGSIFAYSGRGAIITSSGYGTDPKEACYKYSYATRACITIGDNF